MSALSIVSPSKTVMAPGIKAALPLVKICDSFAYISLHGPKRSATPTQDLSYSIALIFCQALTLRSFSMRIMGRSSSSLVIIDCSAPHIKAKPS